MTYGINTCAKNPLPFFQCSRRSKGRCDTSSYISEKNAVASVTSALKNILASDNIEYQKTPLEPQNTEALDLLQSEIDKISGQEKRIKEAYINGIDTLEEYKENKKMLSERKTYLENKILQESRKIPMETEDYENVIRESIAVVLEMIENDADNYVDIGAALSAHVSKIDYIKDENHMKFYLY